MHRSLILTFQCSHTPSHRLTGWNAVKSRVEQLGLKLNDDQIKDATAKIKELADVRT